MNGLCVGLLLGLMAGGVTCRQVSETAPAPIITEESRYMPAGDELTVVATYTNPTDETVFAGYCGRSAPLWHLQKLVDGVWIEAYSPACAAILVTTPAPVPPGGVRRDSLRISLSSDIFPALDPDTLAGTYRVVYDLYSTWEPEGSAPFGDPLPEAMRASNRFEIVARRNS